MLSTCDSLGSQENRIERVLRIDVVDLQQLVMLRSGLQAKTCRLGTREENLGTAAVGATYLRGLPRGFLAMSVSKYTYPHCHSGRRVIYTV